MLRSSRQLLQLSKRTGPVLIRLSKPAISARSSVRFATTYGEDRKDESNEARRKRLIYRSGQRGVLELDLVMGSWAKENVHKLADSQLDEYERIVKAESPDLLKWLVDPKAAPPEVDGPIFRQMQTYTQAARKRWHADARAGNQFNN